MHLVFSSLLINHLPAGLRAVVMQPTEWKVSYRAERLTVVRPELDDKVAMERWQGAAARSPCYRF